MLVMTLSASHVSHEIAGVTQTISGGNFSSFVIEPEKHQFEIDVRDACVYAAAPATLNPPLFVR